MKKIFILIFSLFIMLPLFSEVSLIHEQPVNINNRKSIILDLEIREGFTEIEKVTVFYRQTGILLRS